MARVRRVISVQAGGQESDSQVVIADHDDGASRQVGLELKQIGGQDLRDLGSAAT